LVEGAGLHTGQPCRAAIKPAEEDVGIIFRRDGVSIPARVECVVSTSRSTTLGRNGATVGTVEHILAAMSGLRVDNAVVEVEGAEIPALDGSALPICRAIMSTGLAEQAKPAEYISLSRPIRVESASGFIVALPYSGCRIRYLMSYDHPLIGSQSADYALEDDSFCEKVAPARTFVLYEEVEALRKKSLAQGGSLENVIVVWPDRMSSPPRMPGELSMHKLLDVIGDLSLVGAPLHGEVIAVRSGHALNVRLARRIMGEHSDA